MTKEQDDTRQRTPDVPGATGSPRSPQPEGSAHTPGPWRSEGPDEDPYGEIGVFADAGSRLVCELWQDDAPVPDFNAEQRANARLIAAAPDLLAALKALTQDSRFNLVIGGNPNAVDALVKQVDEAIAKAEGRTS
jgi:hypothetical protein